VWNMAVALFSWTAYLKGDLFYLQQLAGILILLGGLLRFYEQRTVEFIVNIRAE